MTIMIGFADFNETNVSCAEHTELSIPYIEKCFVIVG
jgi:hypothetical protein